MRTLMFSALLCLSISLSWSATVPVEENTEAAAEEATYNNTAAVVGNEEEFTPVLTAEDGTEDEQLQQSRFLYCPPGWFKSGSRCFMYVSSPMNWINAEKFCVNQQAALASVQSPQEYHFLQGLAQVAGRSTAWIGGFYFQGSWMWIDRAGFYYTNWLTQNSVSSFQCIHMSSSSGWSNGNCASALSFICAMDPNSC
ncbi:ladderlectin-like [Clupea harengus]|uniref:Ladderlectin-like n=1 Tax=Clupea harengus TaxID=7950 RepID=A0A8M1KKU9_CLUHA|nr:ladderlectin-like [Clupea harengus]